MKRKLNKIDRVLILLISKRFKTSVRVSLDVCVCVRVREREDTDRERYKKGGKILPKLHPNLNPDNVMFGLCVSKTNMLVS